MLLYTDLLNANPILFLRIGPKIIVRFFVVAKNSLILMSIFNKIFHCLQVSHQFDFSNLTFFTICSIIH